MSASELDEKHRLDAKTIKIEARNISKSVVANQILEICAAISLFDSKS